MMRKNFIRKRENFECENCGAVTCGNGYTDHCPCCLWGKHMDETIPGDRASTCRGLMEPERVIWEKGRYRIFYRCGGCGREFWVKTGIDDDREELIRLAGVSE